MARHSQAQTLVNLLVNLSGHPGRHHPANLPVVLIDAPSPTRTPLRAAIPLLYTVMLFVLFRSAIVFPQGNPGTDFTPIWTAANKYVSGEPVFDSDYTVDMPHYLYTPAGTVLIAPVAIFGSQEVARAVMAAMGALCIIAAIALAVRMVRPQWFHIVFPLAVSFFFITPEPVRSTLTLTNINGFLLLLQVLFIWLSLRLREQKAGWLNQFTRPEAWAAGVIAGVALSIKPQFAVLFIVSLAYWQVAVVVVAALVAAALFAVGWFTIAEPELFFTNLVPYLSEPRPRFNGSVSGLGIVLQWPGALVTVLTLFVIATALGAVAAMWRWKDTDPVLFTFVATGVCFAGGFMASGLMQNYYSIWIIPLALTIVGRQSPMRWPITVLILLFMYAHWVWPETGRETVDVALAYIPSFMFIALPVAVGAWALANRPSEEQQVEAPDNATEANSVHSS